MTRQEEKDFHWAFGKHSQIPGCCIRFFVEEWNEKKMWEDSESPYVIATGMSRAGYVQCPCCLGTGRKVDLLICARECGGEHREDFFPGRYQQ